jgi:2'-hydroxyisoflavone reductase
MKILIIGGTKFLGRHLLRAALANNHEVTLFNRGKFAPKTIDGVEQIHGDRNSDLEKLAGRRWDAVIDTCGYLPQTVKASAEFLCGRVNQYIFVSSISAYKDFSRANFDETAPLAELSEEQKERVEKIDPHGEFSGPVLGEMYGALKALCEHEALHTMPNRALIVRPGLIVGEFDPTDRFSYWVMRGARGGEVLAPGSPNRFVQFIDAHDLARWIIRMAEENENGIFNAVSRPLDLTFQTLLEEIKSAAASDARFTWVTEEFLNRENVGAWGEMPLYLPESDETLQGFLSVNVDKALEKGLSFRPVSETIRATLDWRKTVDDKLKAGISAEREAELLTKWHTQK